MESTTYHFGSDPGPDRLRVPVREGETVPRIRVRLLTFKKVPGPRDLRTLVRTQSRLRDATPCSDRTLLCRLLGLLSTTNTFRRTNNRSDTTKVRGPRVVGKSLWCRVDTLVDLGLESVGVNTCQGSSDDRGYKTYYYLSHDCCGSD